MSDNIFYSNINTDSNISWTTSLDQFYFVRSPSHTTIYIVRGDILPNAGVHKYKINSKGTAQIDISVLTVNQNDAGIYQSISSAGRPNGCCVLIITGWYILFYFFIFTKYMEQFFNLGKYLEEYGVLKSEEILRTWTWEKTQDQYILQVSQKQKRTRTNNYI